MIENTINESSNNTLSTTNELSQINVKVDQQIEEKSTFERAIIEAFKQTNSNECIKKLLIAYDEIKFFIKDINQSNGKKFILNRNFLDKISRIIERKYFNVNILIAKIFEFRDNEANRQFLPLMKKGSQKSLRIDGRYLLLIYLAIL